MEKEFYFYAGDRLKIEYSGESRKMKVVFYGASNAVKTYEQYQKLDEKYDDVHQAEWKITKDGPHTFAVLGTKGKGEIKLIRYPAPGKENAPLTGTKRFEMVYEPEGKAVNGITGYKKKVTTPLTFNNVGNPCYVPGDTPLMDLKLTDFGARKGVVVYDDAVITGPNMPGSSQHRANQRTFAFQQGDTVTFQISLKKPAAGSSYSAVWVTRSDHYHDFRPDVLGGMHFILLGTGQFRVNEPMSRSFVVGADGLFSIFFREDSLYDLKVVRHLGKNGRPDFTIPFKVGYVLREGTNTYYEEPLIGVKP
ncbi:MAG: hypothetical protein ACO1O1_09955 [Adhaeribacter sp.]